MALFADGVTCTIDDLTDQDSGLADVAKTCGINASTKIRLAHEEISTELQLWLERNHPALDMVWAPGLRPAQIVVTPALKQWETMMALSLFYRDAFFSQLVDRYQAKWDAYARLTRSAYERFVQVGMGLVNDPVPQASAPLLSLVPGPQIGGTFYAGIAWVNAAGQEGASSVASSIVVPDGSLMTVAATDSPARTIGFNIYAGTRLEALYLQNSTPLPADIAFTYVPGTVTVGRLPGTGQAPDYTRPLVRTLLRG